MGHLFDQDAGQGEVFGSDGADYYARGVGVGDAVCAYVCWGRGFLVALSVGYIEGLVGFDSKAEE